MQQLSSCFLWALSKQLLHLFATNMTVHCSNTTWRIIALIPIDPFICFLAWLQSLIDMSVKLIAFYYLKLWNLRQYDLLKNNNFKLVIWYDLDLVCWKTTGISFPFSSCFALFCHLEGIEPSSENQEVFPRHVLLVEWKQSVKTNRQDQRSLPVLLTALLHLDQGQHFFLAIGSPVVVV